jgi:hypothetical protein
MFIINKVKPGMLDVKLNIDENLPNYYEGLEDEDKAWMRNEESNLRKKYVSYHFYKI